MARLALVIAAFGLLSCAPAGDFVDVSVGDGRGCAISKDERLTCWGGSDAWEDAGTPTGSFSQVSVGDSHACAIAADEGTATCFGPANAEVLDPGPFAETKFARISAGHNFTCGVRLDDATLACWGINPVRQECALNPEPPPGACDGGVFDPPEGAFTDVSLADLFDNLCALRVDGTAVCWGRRAFSDTVEQPPDDELRAVSAGASHGCGVETDDAATCWGADGEPWATPPSSRFRVVSAGFNHTCGIDLDDAAVCWGAGPAVDADAPDFALTNLDAGAHQTCGVTLEGGLICWGIDDERQARAKGP